MSKYSERLKRTKEQISQDSVDSAEKTAVFSIKKAILGAEEQLSKIEAAKEQALSANPFNLQSVLNLGEEEERVKATKAVAEKLLAEEFTNSSN